MANPSQNASAPDFSEENVLRLKGYEIIAGTDEVGRGPLAGPVVAAAVILDPANYPEGLNDSKKMSKKRREGLFDRILQCSEVSVASISAREIDRTNIRIASLTAMTRAVEGLVRTPDHILVDGNALPPHLATKSTALVKGDSRSLSIAAASIVAKVIRDRMMELACSIHPEYGFSKHAGYGTPAHISALRDHGPTPLHRMTFRPLNDIESLRDLAA